MYIKTLTIQGFKSYRDQTSIEPFSPKHNVVVGRNGSGKSNFFAAIRFVLSDAYTSMSREERQSLLHEGVSVQTTLSAYVEIVFDNSDNRFPTGKPEVVLRRTIGMKKDEYSLDKKTASKADVMNLLESAGFSKSNPYYIVPQGRITALTNASPTDRLSLLKEVAGTRVYETRRTESLKIMAETAVKTSKIVELLEYIESRLAELEEEKEELKEYQAKDKERRCLEYAVYKRELEEVGEKLEAVEEERRAVVHNSNLGREDFNERAAEIKNLEAKIASTSHDISTLDNIRTTSQSELLQLRAQQTDLQLLISDLQSTSSSSSSLRSAHKSELASVTRTIERKEAELTEVRPRWEENKRAEYKAKKALEKASTELKTLFEKKGRLGHYQTKKERDTYLQSEITSLDKSQKAQSSALANAQNALEATKTGLSEVESKIDLTRATMEDSKTRVSALAEQISALKAMQHEKDERRKELWREDAKLQSQASYAGDQLRNAEGELAGMMDKDTGSGMRAVDNIAAKYGLDGVYGPLYRLFEVVDTKFNVAVELTAGNSLFHIVVDNDATASKVLTHLIAEKAGRVTFMPLNRLHPKILAPPPNASDAIPLLSKLTYSPVHAKAFEQVFGKTCVCKDLTIAAAYVKSHGINTITLDGDKVDRKGAMTGGYIDPRRSRIDTIKSATTWRAKYEEDSTKSKEIKNSLIQLDQEITKLVGQQQVLANQQNQARDARLTLHDEGIEYTREAKRLKEAITRVETEIEELERDLANMQTKIDVLKKELASPMAKGLTAAEANQIDLLGKDVDERKTELAEATNRRVETDGLKSMLDIELNESLRRRRDELQAKLDGLSDAQGEDTSSSEDLGARQRELHALVKSISTLTKKITAMEKEVETHSATLQADKTNLESLQTQQSEDSRGISKQQKTTERYLAKKQMLTSRKDECNRNIRDLGVLPEEAFEKYTNDKLDRLMKKLHNVHEGLKKFAHVNKKAFEQYNNFTKQRDQLLDRREDLDKSAQSITELVEVLDQRKDEAIERTFKQVASNFEDVFEKLVPAGRGRLIIQRRLDQDNEDAEVEDTQQSSVENYIGVSIKVSFNSKVDEGLRIQQLSGGQKSLVALATVFAIQKCDPAPFYLFDEIDANLDAQYRTAVASMIQSLSSTAQFITTTFRPEMLVTADKFYGVLFNNQKVSSIRAIKREEAMEFVEQEAQAQ